MTVVVGTTLNNLTGSHSILHVTQDVCKLWSTSTVTAQATEATCLSVLRPASRRLWWTTGLAVCQRVTLSLLDQSGTRKHLADAFRPDPTSSSFKRPTIQWKWHRGARSLTSIPDYRRPIVRTLSTIRCSSRSRSTQLIYLNHNDSWKRTLYQWRRNTRCVRCVRTRHPLSRNWYFWCKIIFSVIHITLMYFCPPRRDNHWPRN